MNQASAQELIKNGSFNSTTANWTTACTSVEAQYYETTYGGTSSTNHVAEVDDESCFYQTVCVLPGMNYTFNMNASRRTGNGTAPNPVTTHIKIEGLNTANTVVGAALVDMDFSRTNTSFSLTPVTGIPTFNVPLGTIVKLKISLTDNTTGYATLGMIVDDISLTFTTPPKMVSADTICQNVNQTFTVSNLPASGITYNWSFGTNATPATSTASNPSVSWSTIGLQQVRCILSNGSCDVDTVLKNVYIGNNPVTPTVTSPIKYCVGDVASPLTATGTGLQWYTSSSGGTASSTPPTPSTATSGNTTYYVSQKSGNCESPLAAITVEVHDNASAAFTYDIHYGCDVDSVVFNNLSVGGGNYEWSFGDNTGSTLQTVSHIYTAKSIFNVMLKNKGDYCRDSVSQSLDLQHPLHAAFNYSKDTICQNQTINFTNTSTATTQNNIAPKYFWDFGDGNTDTTQNPSHTFVKAGIFTVKFAVENFVPCSDTAMHIVYVDTIPSINMDYGDSLICQGKAIQMNVGYESIGNTGVRWDFGDGTIITGRTAVQHAYDSAGIYTVKVTATYRICPDTTASTQVKVKPYPRMDLGRDTAMCPNAGPIVLADFRNASNPDVKWIWNTGDSTYKILVAQPGLYYATATLDGCSVSDSVDVRRDCYINIPNSFTPNGDGTNDYFFPRQFLSKSVEAFRMQIFNRWGQSIFETTSVNGRGWDGKFNNVDQPTGVYIYMIDVVIAGTAPEHYQGNVTLLR
ncbi:PKD domain-containing protein [Taibaiella soli]|uniref:PKD domain-containing protein n=1 Tax=Taibaiella soli TaxID=1649169 RepID=UPI0014035EB1|nr:PKD domain-containing protein [Taibaiella soli]